MKESKMTPSLRKISLYILVIAGSFLVLTAAFIFYTTSNSLNASRESLTTSLGEQIDLFKKSLDSTAGFLWDAMLNNSDIKSIRETDDIHKNNISVRSLQNTFVNRAKLSGQRFSYFFYCPLRELRMHAFTDTINFSTNEKIKEAVRDLIEMGVYNQTHRQWRYYVQDDKVFLLQIYQYKGAYVASWVPLDDLFHVLEAYMIDGDCIALDENKQALLEQDLEKPTQESGTYLLPLYDLNLLLRGAPILDLNNLIVLFGFMLLVLALVLFCFLYTIRYYKNYIERPLRSMQGHVSQYRELLRQQQKKGGFQELEEAADILESVSRQLEELKIESYEEKLLLSKTQLDYYQLQIKPHFFANCFSILFSMAQKKEYERIQDFCLYLSSYVRYLFTSAKDAVPIEAELRHIQDYLSIQRRRRHNAASVTDFVSLDLLECRIPPLILFTIVENSIKHNKRDDLVINIDVQSVEVEGEKKIKLSVYDNGVGFLPEVLQMAKETSATFLSPDGGHIGISNTYRRLYLIYRNDFSYQFYNRAEGGGLVEIIVPREPPDPMA